MHPFLPGPTLRPFRLGPPSAPFSSAQRPLDDQEPEGGGCSHKGGDPNCGFRTDHRVLVYASDDLSNGSWRYAGDALPVSGGRPDAIYFR